MTASAPPLFRDPLHDGATDPTLIFNRAERSWWMVYTQRRADDPAVPGVAWVHGTDLGVASSDDGGETWTYRGVIEGLDTEWGRTTYWAPEIVDDGERYHMYVSVIRGVPDRWEGHPRRIRHYVSDDLVRWSAASVLELSSDRVIDACVAARPEGGWRLWYKDEGHESETWVAESDDLRAWTVAGSAVATPGGHEGPNVFRLGGWWWMIVDAWRGQLVFRSGDQRSWEQRGIVLDAPGSRADDAAIGNHADVVPIADDAAVIVYFTHPGGSFTADRITPDERRSSVQAAVLRVVDGELVCDRDAALPVPLLPVGGPAA